MRDDGLWVHAAGFVLPPGGESGVGRDCGCPASLCADRWEGVDSELGLLHFGVGLPDRGGVRTIPGGVHERAGLFTAHETYIGVIEACVVKISNGPQFPREDGSEKRGVGMRFVCRSLVARFLFGFADDGLIVAKSSDELVVPLLHLSCFARFNFVAR